MAKRKVKPGKAIKWTDVQLEDLVRVSDLDIENAATWWQTYAPNKYKNLLNATNTTDENNA